MQAWKSMAVVLLVLPFAAHADVNKTVGPLHCGIYNQMARPYVEKELETQSKEWSRYTMEIVTRNGKRITVEIQNVNIVLKGERNHVSVFLDGKPLAKTSHQDVPLYLEVHVDDEKYRVICVRHDLPEEAEQQSHARRGK